MDWPPSCVKWKNELYRSFDSRRALGNCENRSGWLVSIATTRGVLTRFDRHRETVGVRRTTIADLLFPSGVDPQRANR